MSLGVRCAAPRERPASAESVEEGYRIASCERNTRNWRVGAGSWRREALPRRTFKHSAGICVKE